MSGHTFIGTVGSCAGGGMDGGDEVLSTLVSFDLFQILAPGGAGASFFFDTDDLLRWRRRCWRGCATGASGVGIEVVEVILVVVVASVVDACGECMLKLIGAVAADRWCAGGNAGHVQGQPALQTARQGNPSLLLGARALRPTRPFWDG